MAFGCFFFDYDKTDVRSDARDTLTKDAAALKAILADFPSASMTAMCSPDQAQKLAGPAQGYGTVS